MTISHSSDQWATAHVSPGAIVGEHADCGGEIVVLATATFREPDEQRSCAMCEKCGKRYLLTLRAELEAV